MKIYHFSRVNKPEFVLSPKYFGKNPFTQRETRVEGTPKIFFYTNIKDKENFFYKSGYNLYTTDINKTDVYDIRKDPLKLKDSDKTLAQIVKFVKKNYKGLLYNVGFDILAYFYPIKVKLAKSKISEGVSKCDEQHDNIQDSLLYLYFDILQERGMKL